MVDLRGATEKGGKGVGARALRASAPLSALVLGVALFAYVWPFPTVARVSLECHAPSYTDSAALCTVNCGRWVKDDVAAVEDIEQLEELVRTVLGWVNGGGIGGPSVVDLHQRVVSYRDQFVGLDHVLAIRNATIPEAYKDAYRRVRTKALAFIAEVTGVRGLHHDMGFFSSINGTQEAKTVHDEYWHQHVDTEQYGSFAYTAMVYLNGKEAFGGGDFVFGDEMVVAPKKGRMLVFSSGAENPHRVLPVQWGVRVGMLTSSTCVAERAVDLAAI